MKDCNCIGFWKKRTNFIYFCLWELSSNLFLNSKKPLFFSFLEHSCRPFIDMRGKNRYFVFSSIFDF